MSDSLHTILEAWSFPSKVESVVPYGEGHINSTFLVTLEDQTRYILQRINTAIFTNPQALMENVVRVTDFQREKIRAAGGDPMREAMHVIFTRDNKAFFTDDKNNAWRVLDCVSGSLCLQRVENDELFATAADAFGRFARILNDFPAETLNETIPAFHHTPGRYDAFEKAVQADVCYRAKDVAEEIAFVRARKADCAVLTDQLASRALPLRVTHNDTKLNNVLLDEKTRKGLCVIDLDTVMPGLLAYDFGDAIRFGANDCAEDEPDQSKVHFSLPLYKVYADSYLAAVGDLLTKQEKESLAWGARLMTLECGIRFLADYLQGDVYFHTMREGQNLDRARTQFTLVRQMEEQFDEMLRILA